jgi:hypothetical protein
MNSVLKDLHLPDSECVYCGTTLNRDTVVYFRDYDYVGIKHVCSNCHETNGIMGIAVSEEKINKWNGYLKPFSKLFK